MASLRDTDVVSRSYKNANTRIAVEFRSVYPTRTADYSSVVRVSKFMLLNHRTNLDIHMSCVAVIVPILIMFGEL